MCDSNYKQKMFKEKVSVGIMTFSLHH